MIFKEGIKTNLKSILRICIPGSIKTNIRGIFEQYLINNAKKNNYKALEKLQNKKSIRCVFLALTADAWKYDGVYRLMKDNPRFDPVILVCPIVNNGRENMIERLHSCFNYFQEKGYNVIQSYNEENDTYVDIREELNADILFYTNPYPALIDKRYFITNFLDYLTVYVGYYFNESIQYGMAYDELLHNLVWRRYLETPEHKGFAIKYSRNKGVNAVVTGYPGVERLVYNTNRVLDDCWKIKDRSLKRIIWAPHHSLVGKVRHSCFLDYCDEMLQYAQKYRSDVQFVFKPHPLLKNILYKMWGKEKTDSYYRQWKEMPNTAYKVGDYSDLFLTSDAMIHDSGSFLVEYLYVNKPVLKTLNEIPLSEIHNPFGLRCIDCYYLARKAKDIEEFIQNVIKGVDPLKDKRTAFVEKELLLLSSPSQNILNDIIDSIDNQILYRN